MIPQAANSNFTLQVDHVEAFEEAEGIELELGHVLLRSMEVGVGTVFDAAFLDQIILDSCEIAGIRRSHAGVHDEPQIGVVAVEGGLKEDLFPLTSIRSSTRCILRHGGLEE